MKYLILLVIVFNLIACKEVKKETTVNDKIELETEIDPKELTTDFKKWWAYHNDTIKFSYDFIGLNADSKKISKKSFLEALTTGKYVPIKLNSSEDTHTYQLYAFVVTTENKGIIAAIKNVSKKALNNYLLEGTKFPDFTFTDMNNNQYSNASVIGKTVLFKCWFIKCEPCVAEIPQLNALVNQFEDNDNILFISLALDSKEKLEQFLAKKEFKYATIPNQTAFIENQLIVKQYPTHIVVNKDGVILKVVIDANELAYFLKKDILATTNNSMELPPPPGPGN